MLPPFLTYPQGDRENSLGKSQSKRKRKTENQRLVGNYSRIEGRNLCPSFFYLCNMFDLMSTKLGELLLTSKRLDFTTIWKAVFDDEQFKTEILDWIRWEQLYNEGVDELGEIIGTYSTYTELLNPEKQAGTPYTLHDTGAFYSSMVLTALDNAIEIDADPIKVDEFGQTTDLFSEYGEEIIGLTDDNKTRLANELVERFQKEAAKILFGD